jgi:hypothetical protein
MMSLQAGCWRHRVRHADTNSPVHQLTKFLLSGRGVRERGRDVAVLARPLCVVQRLVGAGDDDARIELAVLGDGEADADGRRQRRVSCRDAQLGELLEEL